MTSKPTKGTKQPPAAKAGVLPDREPMQPLPAWEALAPDGMVDGLHLGEELDELLRRYQGGEHVALLQAFKLCSYFRVVPPDWVLFETGRAMTLYTTAYVRTLDEAFRVNRGQGERIEGTRNTVLLTAGIRLAVDRAIAAKKGRTRTTFDEVGEEFGISGALCEEIYYGNKR